jgi:hypothetical protein
MSTFNILLHIQTDLFMLMLIDARLIQLKRRLPRRILKLLRMVKDLSGFQICAFFPGPQVTSPQTYPWLGS